MQSRTTSPLRWRIILRSPSWRVERSRSDLDIVTFATTYAIADCCPPGHVRGVVSLLIFWNSLQVTLLILSDSRGTILAGGMMTSVGVRIALSAIFVGDLDFFLESAAISRLGPRIRISRLLVDLCHNDLGILTLASRQDAARCREVRSSWIAFCAWPLILAIIRHYCSGIWQREARHVVLFGL